MLHLTKPLSGLLFLLGIAILSTSARGAAHPSYSAPILFEVPLTSQSTDYSCGAASLQAVMQYYGQPFTEQEIMLATGTNATFGTRLSKMAEFAAQHGVPNEIRFGLTLYDLAANLRTGNPVIVEEQAWPDDKPPIDYVNDWKDGHDVVVIGIDTHNVYFMDPVLFGSRGYIPIREFETRWHDVTFSGEQLQHRALFFHGTPKPPSQWVQVP